MQLDTHFVQTMSQVDSSHDHDRVLLLRVCNSDEELSFSLRLMKSSFYLRIPPAVQSVRLVTFFAPTLRCYFKTLAGEVLCLSRGRKLMTSRRSIWILSIRSFLPRYMPCATTIWGLQEQTCLDPDE